MEKRAAADQGPNAQKKEKLDEFGRESRPSSESHMIEKEGYSARHNRDPYSDRRDSTRRRESGGERSYGRDRHSRDNYHNNNYRRRREDSWDHDENHSRDLRDTRDDWSGHNNNNFHHRSRGSNWTLLSLKQWSDRQQYPDDISQEQIEKDYEKYKERTQQKQSLSFFDEFKNTEFMKERFHPEYLEKSWLEKKKLSAAAAATFKEKVSSQSDTFDFSYNVLESYQGQKTKEDDHNKSTSEGGEKKEEDEKTENESKKEEKTAEPEEVIKESKQEQTEVERPEQLFDNPPEITILFIKNIDHTTKKTELIDIFSQSPGFKKISISDPIAKKDFFRIGWVHYDSSQNCQEAVQKFNGYKLKNNSELSVALNLTTTEKFPQVAPSISADDTRVESHFKLAQNLSQVLDKEKDLQNDVCLSSYMNESGNASHDLDMYLGYLRDVHFFCFYCGEEYDDSEDLLRKCGPAHLRGKKRDEPVSVPDEEQWVRELEAKLKSRVEHPTDFETLFGKKLIAKYRENFLMKSMTTLEAERFKCNLCSKLFRSDEFVMKHINNRHQEQIDEATDEALEAQYMNNYSNDCKRAGYSYPSSFLRTNNPNANRSFRGKSPFKGSNFGQLNRGFSPRNSNPIRGKLPLNKGPRLPIDPNLMSDPRGLRSYDDLDAPTDDIPNFDY